MPPILKEKLQWDTQYLKYFEVVDFEEDNFFAVYECREDATITSDKDEKELSNAEKMKLNSL